MVIPGEKLRWVRVGHHSIRKMACDSNWSCIRNVWILRPSIHEGWCWIRGFSWWRWCVL